MPIPHKKGKKVRYRVKKTKKGNIRLAFVDNKVVEAKKLPKAKKKKKRK